MKQELALEVRDLRKSFGKLQAVKGISFQITPNQCFGLLGPNGAGKTTTVELLEGLISPDSGEILYYGECKAPGSRHDTGIQFQSTTLQDFLTVRENIEMFSSFYSKHLPFDELIEICSLEGFLNQDVRKLSGGQRQRVALALALINDPKLIFLDEPTMGLDPQARRNFWELIERIKHQEKTIILTTHYMDEAYTLCDEVLIMDKGEIIIQGKPHTLVASHFDGFQINIPVRSFPDLTVLNSIGLSHTVLADIVTIKSNDINQSLALLVASKVALDDMVIRKPTLEDLFIDLTGHSLRD